MESELYPHGVDCIWMASDQDGYLAVFSTAGIGPIPKILLNLINDDSKDIEPIIYSMPINSETISLKHVVNQDSFVNLGRRGFFVFDWTDIERTYANAINAYEVMVRPVNPLNIGDLPAVLLPIALDVKLAGMSFQVEQRVNIERLIPCWRG